MGLNILNPELKEHLQDYLILEKTTEKMIMHHEISEEVALELITREVKILNEEFQEAEIEIFSHKKD